LKACEALYVHPQSADWSEVEAQCKEIAYTLIEEDRLVERLANARGEYRRVLEDRIYLTRVAQVGLAGGAADICAALGHNTIPFPKGK
jgi:hypothetical protein